MGSTGGRFTRRRAIAVLLPALCAGLHAEEAWPQRPVRVIVPAPPGGALGRIAELLVDRLSERLGQPLYLDYRPGAGGVVATSLLARGPKDGHAVGIVLGSHAINAATRKNLPYRSVEDFEPVCLIGRATIALVAHPSFPADDVAGLIAVARGKREPLQYGSLGMGSGTHLAAEMLRAYTGIALSHIPYKGSADVYRDLLPGRIRVAFVTLDSAMPHVKSERLKLLALATQRRSAAYPQFPTIGEMLQGYDASGFFGLMAPAGTPRPVIDQLAAHVVAVLHDPDVDLALRQAGIEVIGAPPAEFAGALRREIARYEEVVRRSGVVIE